MKEYKLKWTFPDEIENGFRFIRKKIIEGEKAIQVTEDCIFRFPDDTLIRFPDDTYVVCKKDHFLIWNPGDDFEVLSEEEFNEQYEFIK